MIDMGRVLDAAALTMTLYVLSRCIYEVAFVPVPVHARCGHCGGKKVNDSREFCLRCTDDAS